jgi:hypothetical protein
MLGYFSLIGLLRVHVLLGDFTLALKVMENIELNQKVGSLLAFKNVKTLIFIPTGLLYASDSLPCCYLLLCRIFLHGFTPIQ